MLSLRMHSFAQAHQQYEMRHNGVQEWVEPAALMPEFGEYIAKHHRVADFEQVLFSTKES
jgi:hypothetical protein